MTDQHSAPGCSHSELAVGWALHALEPAEEFLIAAHLPNCSECTRTVAETELVGAVLGLSVPQVIPSPGLEQRVLAGTSTAQASPVVPPAPSTRPAPPMFQVNGRFPIAPAPSPSPRRPPPRRPRRRQPICVPETLVLVSAALAIFILAFVIVLYLIP